MSKTKEGRQCTGLLCENIVKSKKDFTSIERIVNSYSKLSQVHKNIFLMRTKNKDPYNKRNCVWGKGENEASSHMTHDCCKGTINFFFIAIYSIVHTFYYYYVLLFISIPIRTLNYNWFLLFFQDRNCPSWTRDLILLQSNKMKQKDLEKWVQ